MATYNRPGVYINELPLAAAPVNLAATANAAGAVIAAFERGSDQITKVTSWYDFTQTFGGYNAKYPATFSVGSFFKNGGSELYVKRIFPSSSKKVAKATVGYTGNGTGTLCTIAAKHRGVDGNNIRVVIAASKAVRLTGYYDITVYYDGNNPTTTTVTDDTIVEQFNAVIFHDATSGDYAPTVLAFGSEYIKILEGSETEYNSDGTVISPKVSYSVAKSADSNNLYVPQTTTVVLTGAPTSAVNFVYGDYTGNTVYNPSASSTGTFSVTDCSVFKEFEVVDQPLVFFLPDVVGLVADSPTGKTFTPTKVFYNYAAKTAKFTTATAHPFLVGDTVSFKNLVGTNLDTGSDIVGTGASGTGVTASKVTVTSTANLRVGMTVTIVSGTGTFPSTPVITAIENSTTFVVSVAPSVALFNAVLSFDWFAGSLVPFKSSDASFPITAITTTSPYTFTVSVPNGGSYDIGTSAIPRELSAGIASVDVGSGWGIAKEVYKALQSWSETDNSSKRHFVVLETSPNLSVDEALSQAGDLNSNSRSAVYYPQVYIKDPLGKSGNAVRKIGPSGSVAGLFLATDRRVGPFKAAAGIDAVIKDALALERAFSPAELDQLNSGTSSTGSISGKNVVNAIRNVPGAGVVVMGGRTLLQDGSANRYINMRRSLSYIEKRLNDLSTFALFENNTETLWARLITVLGVFLNDYRNQGGLRGTTPEQSFYIKCDEENNTVATIQDGEVHVEIGVALEYPAEFVVINLSQKTAE